MTIHGRFPCRIGRRLDSKRPANSAKDAADHTTDDDADRSCCLGTYVRAMHNAIGDALSLRCKRESE
jgi:hypothetical protein